MCGRLAAGLLALSTVVAATPGAAEQGAAGTPIPDAAGMEHVGKIHDKLRAAKRREAQSLALEPGTAGARYSTMKKEIEAATGRGEQRRDLNSDERGGIQRSRPLPVSGVPR